MICIHLAIDRRKAYYIERSFFTVETPKNCLQRIGIVCKNLFGEWSWEASSFFYDDFDGIVYTKKDENDEIVIY
jgi:hypothetical protein